jgi:tRNA modification GTPase
VEATLDFPEEEIDFLQKADAAGQLDRIQSSLKELFAKASQGALLREGIRVVIAGQPNAGKSSLLNALAGAELAIVTPIAGTTRDRVQETIQIEGVPIHVIDTAGLRESDDMVEQIGISRAWEAIAAADVVLFLHDLTRVNQTDYQLGDAAIAATLQEKLPPGVPVIDVWNKADAVQASLDHAGITLSAKTGSGLDALRQALLHAAGWQPANGGNFIARERHIQALRRVAQHCEYAAAHLGAHAQSLDLLAEELRLAQGALGEITGEFSSDDLLGVIFSQFCIGK